MTHKHDEANCACKAALAKIEVYKIYSAVDADELKKLIDRGFVIKGYPGDNLDQIHARVGAEWPVQLHCVAGTAKAARFNTAARSANAGNWLLFGMTAVVREQVVTNIVHLGRQNK